MNYLNVLPQTVIVGMALGFGGVIGVLIGAATMQLIDKFAKLFVAALLRGKQ